MPPTVVRAVSFEYHGFVIPYRLKNGNSRRWSVRSYDSKGPWRWTGCTSYQPCACSANASLMPGFVGGRPFQLPESGTVQPFGITQASGHPALTPSHPSRWTRSASGIGSTSGGTRSHSLPIS